MVNGDIWCDADFLALAQAASALRADRDLAHLLLVPNPAHNPGGDFVLRGDRVFDESEGRLTFSGIGAYHPSLFDGLDRDAPAKLAPLLRAAMREGRVSGALHRGHWHDVGTPQRLAEVDALARKAG